MSHARKLFFDGAIMTISQIGAFLVSIVFSAYILRTLSKEEVAIIALPVIFEGIISLIKDFGLATSAIKKVPLLWKRRRYREARGLIRTAWLVPLAASVLLAGVMFLLRSELSFWFLKDRQWSYLIPWVVMYALAGSILNQEFLLLQALQKFKDISAISFTVSLLQKIIPFVLLLKWGVLGYLIGFAGVTWLGVGAGVWRLEKQLLGKAVAPSLLAFIRQSFPYYLSGYARYLFYQADQVLVALLMGPTVLAVYFVVRSIVRQICLFWDTFFVPLSPKLAELKSRQGNKELINNIKVMLNLTGLVLLIVVLGLIALSRTGLDIYTGGRYSEFSWLLSLMALMLLPYGLLTVVGSVVYILGTAVDRLKLEVFTGVVSFSLQLILLPSFKLLGAALAQVLCFGMALLFGVLLLRKYKVRFDGPFFSKLTVMAVITIPLAWILARQNVIVQLVGLLGIVGFTFIGGWMGLERQTRNWLWDGGKSIFDKVMPLRSESKG